MLTVIAAASMLALAVDTAPQKPRSPLLACLRTQAAAWDDGVSDAATIAKVAMAKCNDLLNATATDILTASAVPISNVTVEYIREKMAPTYTQITVQYVIEYRRSQGQPSVRH